MSGWRSTSRMDSALSTATFTNLQVAAGPVTTTLPAPWTSRDLGSPALAGSALASGGTFVVAAGGANIWGTSDEFHFVYQPLQGDVEVIARLASLQYTDGRSKAGVMIRESLTGGSRYAFMMGSGTQGWGFQRRIETGDVSYRQSGPSGTAPGWVRLVREGNLFSAYRSTTGTTWSLIGSDTISMASTVYVGVALTSHNTAQRATATFTNLTARTLTPGTNQPPTVSITGPTTGATFTAPATITVTATASDTGWHDCEGRVLPWFDADRVDATSPYLATWTNVAAGTYQLNAVATDSDGDTTDVCAGQRDGQLADQSAADGEAHSPAAGSTFTAPASLTITATASDSDGIARVEFYAGSQRIGSDTTCPYQAAWSTATAGNYSFKAVAYDNRGGVQESGAVAVIITAAAPPPPKPPTTSVAFKASADHATNVDRYIVAIYRGADNPATASPVTTRDLDKPTPAAGEITVDISTLVNPLPAGSYKAVVRALGPGGTTASEPSLPFDK